MWWWGGMAERGRGGRGAAGISLTDGRVKGSWIQGVCWEKPRAKGAPPASGEIGGRYYEAQSKKILRHTQIG